MVSHMVSHICRWYIPFSLFIFQCSEFPYMLIVSARYGFPLTLISLSPSWWYALFSLLRFFYAWFMVPAQKRCATIHVVCMVFVVVVTFLSENGLWLWTKLSFVYSTSDSLRTNISMISLHVVTLQFETLNWWPSHNYYVVYWSTIQTRLICWTGIAVSKNVHYLEKLNAIYWLVDHLGPDIRFIGSISYLQSHPMMFARFFHVLDTIKSAPSSCKYW